MKASGANGEGTDLLLVSTPLEAWDLPGGLCPSLSTLTLGSHLRARGADVRVLDPSVEVSAPPAELLDAVAEAAIGHHPKAVGVSCLSTAEGRFGVALARQLKLRDSTLPVVLGGIWAAPSAAEILRRFPVVDAVVAGAGEAACEALAAGGLEALKDARGAVFRDESGGVIARPPAEALPSASPLDLSLLAKPEAYDIFCWETSRGCPFSCSFCTEAMSSPSHQHASLEVVTEDARALAAHGWYVWLCDPLFGAGRKRTREVVKAFGDAGLNFLAESRVDVVHPDDIPLIASSGCDLLYLGLESASRASLLTLGKIDQRPSRHLHYLDRARAVVRACLENDILPVLGVLNPVPGDGEKELEGTLAFLAELADMGSQPWARGPGPWFHAFPLRLDRGSAMDAEPTELWSGGATFDGMEDPLFADRTLRSASPEVDEVRARRFRETVVSLNPRSEEAQQRVMRSFPRRFAEFEVAT